MIAVCSVAAGRGRYRIAAGGAYEVSSKGRGSSGRRAERATGSRAEGEHKEDKKKNSKKFSFYLRNSTPGSVRNSCNGYLPTRSMEIGRGGPRQA